MNIHTNRIYIHNKKSLLYKILSSLFLFFCSSVLYADDFNYTHQDTGACSFPFLYSFTGSMKSNLTKNGTTYNGKYSYSLQNLNTGYTVTFNGGGPSSDDGNNLVTLLGDNPGYSPSSLWPGYPNGSGGVLDPAYPVEIFHGTTVVDLSLNTVIERNGSTDLVNPCQILSANNYNPPEPRSTPAPWTIPNVDVVSGMQRAGVLAVDFQQPVGHIHTHLDIFINGQLTIIPAGIGMVEPFVAPNGNFFSFVEMARLHTHRTNGIIHIEPDFKPLGPYTLGQFFDIWQVKLNQNQIGAYCTYNQQNDANCLPDRQNLSVYINGQLYSGDPRQIQLHDLNEIAIVYGSAPSSGIPNCYAWPSVYGGIPGVTPGDCALP